MMSHLVRRRVAIPMAGTLAIVAAVIAVAATGAPARSQTSDTAGNPIFGSELALRNDMRKLWEDHVTWTRMVIVSFAGGLDDREAAVGRLLQNQKDLGDAIKPFYGDAAGNQLTALLTDHIVIAADILTALGSGDADALDAAIAKWRANGNDIADFLSSANPTSWPRDHMRMMMSDHLDATAAEAIARFEGRWEDDVKAYDAAHEQALGMADMLSDGIVAAFKTRFRP